MKHTMFTCFNCDEILEKIQLNKEIKDVQICIDCFETHYVECVECGEYHHENTMTETNDGDVCPDCLESDYLICKDCEEYHNVDELTEIEHSRENFYVCDSCLSDNTEYYYCEECGTYRDNNDCSQVEVYDVDRGHELYMCEDCEDSDWNIIYCEYHERTEKVSEYYHVENYGKICDEAYEYGSFYRCDGCDEVYHGDDIYELNDSLYCGSCYDEHQEQGKIKSYHEHKTEYIKNHKVLNTSDNVLTYGFELEVERGSGACSCGDMSEELHEVLEGFTVYESDGSLDDGFEIISNPFDMEYYESEGKNLIKYMLSELQTSNFISHDTTTCGLHIHVGRQGLGNSYGERLKTIEKINCIVEYFKEELTLLSRRKESQLNRWAKFMTSNASKEELTKDIIVDMMGDYRGRYSALNLNNEPTIEFRLFRGTLKKETFLSTLELVNNICMWCKNNTIDTLNDLDFYTIATYDKKEYIPEYLKSKNILPKQLA